MPPKIPLVYTFGNHMHWVDMQWLWGYHVLPGSIRDMLHLIDQTGAKGNVNFDGVGYEKLAAEDPEALQDLKIAVQEGKVEPVGCSYGQPYGLFHGGESNIRQRIYGARAVRRLLGVWPQTFWEEEFDFFPQLPQILAQTGFKYASLYFQWTWHTPEVPVEPHAAILWEGIDGTRLVTAPRNNLNLHQWPEDFQILLNDLATKGPQEVLGTPESDPNQTPPLILQWLELMPSPDWMCRSEVMLPKLQELLQDPRFEVTCQTLGEYLATQNPKTLPLRPYSLDQTWHGLTLGKNSDWLRTCSKRAERSILSSESLATLMAYMGRPYGQWDVYPTWELEENWRNLLIAQHHDNDECEGLCGHVGRTYYNSCLAEPRFADRFSAPHSKDSNAWRYFNPNGWTIQDHLGVSVPPFALHNEEPAHTYTVSPRPIPIQELLAPKSHKEPKWPEVSSVQQGELTSATFRLIEEYQDQHRVTATGFNPKMTLSIFRMRTSEWARFTISTATPPDPGLNSGYQISIPVNFKISKVIADSPFCVQEVKPTEMKRLRKYPKGDWMTSEQWFEDVPPGFTAHTFIDILDENGNGLLISHEGTRQWFWDEKGIRLVLGAIDPWDEDKSEQVSTAEFLMIGHGPITNADRYRMANHQELIAINPNEARFPERFGPLNLTSDTDGVVATAFYRETEDFAGKHVENYAGTGIGYPTVLRLVEFNGEPADVTLQLAGPVVKAFKTNLLGQIQEELQPTPCPTPDFGHPFEWSELTFKMKPREILTLYLDIVPARKQTRDLDAKRKIWATIHRTNP